MADYRRNNKSSSSRSFGKVIDINRIDDYHHSIKQTNLNLKQSIVINNKNNGHDDDHEDSNNKMFKTTTLKNDERISNQNHDKENGQNAKIKKSTTAVNEKRKSSTSNTTVVIHDDNSDDHHNNVDDNKSNDDDDDEFHKSKMLKWMTVSNLEFENNDQDRYHYHMIELRTTFETLIQMDEKNKRLQTKIENIRNENEQLELMKDEIDQIYASFITTEE